ncbi:MAG: nucleotide sugar dehydrogenase [Actinomycetes bacterium]
MSLDASASLGTQRSCAPASVMALPSQPGTVIDLTTASQREDAASDRRWDVAVVGLGPSALSVALAFHSAGCRVLGLDADRRRLAAARAGHVELSDSDRSRLEQALADHHYFELTSDTEDLRHTTAVIIAVPTPLDEHQLPDLSILRAACETVVESAVSGQTIIVSSTTYVGCTRELLVRPLAEKGLRPGLDVHVAFSPAHAGTGGALAGRDEAPRVVGGVTAGCTRAAAAVIGRLTSTVHLVSSLEAAEMTRLLETCYRAVNLAFINEFADAARVFGLDVAELIGAASTRADRCAPFWPSAGAGGDAMPSEPQYLLWQLRKQRMSTPLVEHTMRSIAQRPLQVVDRACELLMQHRIPMRGAHVLVVGAAYQPDVADADGSPALDILHGLMSIGADVHYYDPLVPEVRLHDGRALQTLANPRAVDADLVIVHTVHSGQTLDWLPRTAVVLDTTYRLGRETGRHLL